MDRFEGRAARLATRLGATATGLALSRHLPELPDDRHPVARFGQSMAAVERLVYRDDRRAGVVYTTAGVTLGALMGRVPTSVAVAGTVAGAQLRRAATDVARLLEADDLPAARGAMPTLVGRDPGDLDASGLAAATIESVAENMVDAVFSPVLWAIVAGGPGAGAYRAVNTMDAMVGHRSPRHERFGWASARLDDAANLVPAHAFVAAVLAARPSRAGDVVRAVRGGGSRHPSPSAGPAEAAMAGALGVELGGPLRYGDRVQVRPLLGHGPRPAAGDVHRAVELAARTEDLLGAALATGALVAGVAAALGRRGTGAAA